MVAKQEKIAHTYTDLTTKLLSGRTFSLGHVLVGSVPGGAITIAHDNRETVVGDDVRRRATACDGARHATTRKVRRLMRRETASRHGTLTIDGSQGPPEAIYEQSFNDE